MFPHTCFNQLGVMVARPGDAASVSASLICLIKVPLRVTGLWQAVFEGKGEEVRQKVPVCYGCFTSLPSSPCAVLMEFTCLGTGLSFHTVISATGSSSSADALLTPERRCLMRHTGYPRPPGSEAEALLPPPTALVSPNALTMRHLFALSVDRRR